MADRVLRDLERAFAVSKQPEDEERWLLARVRAGELEPGDLIAWDVRVDPAPGGLVALQLGLARLRREHPTVSWAAGAAGVRVSGPSTALIERCLSDLRRAGTASFPGPPAIARRQALAEEMRVRLWCDGLEPGLPFAGLAARLVDAREHPVDSTADAFARATREALREAVQRAGVVLEPRFDAAGRLLPRAAR